MWAIYNFSTRHPMSHIKKDISVIPYNAFMGTSTLPLKSDDFFEYIMPDLSSDVILSPKLGFIPLLCDYLVLILSVLL